MSHMLRMNLRVNLMVVLVVMFDGNESDFCGSCVSWLIDLTWACWDVLFLFEWITGTQIKYHSMIKNLVKQGWTLLNGQMYVNSVLCVIKLSTAVHCIL
jgi:hypothetical protein